VELLEQITVKFADFKYACRLNLDKINNPIFTFKVVTPKNDIW